MAKRDDDVYKQIKIPIGDTDDAKGIDRKFWNRTERKQWATGLFAGCGVLYACRTVTPLVVAAMAKEFGWDKTQSGSVLSCFFWGYTMTQFLGGYLADKVGGDVVLPIAACFWSMITFWTPQLAYLSTDKYLTLHILIVSRVFLGIFQGFHYPSMSSVVSRKVSEQERSLTYSFICSGSHLGTLLCGSIGSVLLDKYGWQSVFYFAGLSSVTWMLLLRYLLIEKHRKKYVPLVSVADGSGPKSTHKAEKSVPWLTLFVKPAFWSLLVGHFCENNAFFILLSWLPTYFHENFPDAKGWVFNVVPWVVTMFSSVLGGWIADHMLAKGFSVTFVRKFMESIALCGTSAALVMISYTTSYYSALFIMAIAVACCGFHNSGILVNPQDIAPKHAGAVFGIMNMAGAVPGFVGVYMAGHILEATKSWAAVFNQTAGVCLFGWMVYIIFGTGKQLV
ncbi:voltage-gated purine nucleotide uniporter SLC17A9-like isoform X1 [Argopecten irradians]|uniref:voltage-gated purine nucleotide uniporter SLC17A9-like isoform X1 n=1 Tax=Argopecten irradians TaxID=31199 RepID=UPI0037214130